MAGKGKAITFYGCNLFIFISSAIDERPAMGSQPNLDSRSEVVSIYKCPTEISAISPPRFDRSPRNLARWRILAVRTGPFDGERFVSNVYLL